MVQIYYWELLYLTLHRLDLPKHWLDCDMIFLAKKVSQTTDPSAVRPIMLFDTAYKVYMGVVSELLEQQLAQSNWWGPGQKARKGTDGTLEAGNLLDALINQARRENTRLYILWIDIKNAFGSLGRSGTISNAALRYSGSLPSASMSSPR